MKKKLLAFTGIVLLCCIAWGLYLFYKPHSGVENIKPAVTIAATALYQQYNADEKYGDSIFLDKVIEVKGIVSDEQKTDSTLNILIKASDLGGINCSLSLKDNKNISMPAIGENITLKGKCTGFLMDVELVDCVVIK
jgi:hypothetical protein